MTVYGTVAVANPPDSSLTFSIDNDASLTGSYTPSGTLTSAAYHTELWASPTFANGMHTLVITQTAAQANGVIYLDYLLYSTTSDSVATYFIDDRDPRVTYAPAWQQSTNTLFMMQTASESANQGDSFMLEFEGTFHSLFFLPADACGFVYRHRCGILRLDHGHNDGGGDGS